jgi:hypothetical protein
MRLRQGLDKLLLLRLNRKMVKEQRILSNWYNIGNSELYYKGNKLHEPLIITSPTNFDLRDGCYKRNYSVQCTLSSFVSSFAYKSSYAIPLT